MTLEEKRRRTSILAVAIQAGMATEEEKEEFRRLTNEIVQELAEKKSPLN